MTLLFPFVRDGSYGLMNQAGEVVYEPEFVYAHRSSEGRCVLASAECSLVILQVETGRFLKLPGLHAGVNNFSQGLLCVKDARYRDVRPGYVDVIYQGYISTGGEVVVEPQFANARPFDRFGATVKINRTDRYQKRIDFDGVFMGPPYESILIFHPEGKMSGARLNEDKMEYVPIDGHGERIGKGVYEYVWQEHEGLIPVHFVDGKVGWIDDAGSDVKKLDYDAIGNHFESGRVPVEGKSEKWGLMDTEGSWVVEPIFDHVASVGPNRYEMGHLDEHQILSVQLTDADGVLISEDRFESIGRFQNGYARVWRFPPDASVPEEDEYVQREFNFIDLNSRLITPRWS